MGFASVNVAFSSGTVAPKYYHMEGDLNGHHIQADGANHDANSDGYVDAQYLKDFTGSDGTSKYSLEVNDGNKDLPQGEHWFGKSTITVRDQNGNASVYNYDNKTQTLEAQDEKQKGTIKQWQIGNYHEKMDDKAAMDVRRQIGAPIIDNDHDGYLDQVQRGIELADGTRIVTEYGPTSLHVLDAKGENMYNLNLNYREPDRDLAFAYGAIEQGGGVLVGDKIIRSKEEMKAFAEKDSDGSVGAANNISLSTDDSMKDLFFTRADEVKKSDNSISDLVDKKAKDKGIGDWGGWPWNW